LLIRHSKYSAMLLKIHSYRLLFRVVTKINKIRIISKFRFSGYNIFKG